MKKELKKALRRIKIDKEEYIAYSKIFNNKVEINPGIYFLERQIDTDKATVKHYKTFLKDTVIFSTFLNK